MLEYKLENDLPYKKELIDMEETTYLTDEQIAKKKKRQKIWDKITTGILILLMVTPILILAYIFIWFMSK